MNQRQPQGAGHRQSVQTGRVQDPAAAARRRRLREKQKRKRRMLRIGTVAVCLALLGALCWMIVSFCIKKGEAPARDTAETNSDAGHPGEATEGTAPESSTAAAGTEAPPAETEPALPQATFTADLSAYEMYMDPAGEERDAYLLLVNTAHPLTASDVPSDLTDLVNTRKDGRNTQQMRLFAAKALEALFKEADACGMLNQSTGYELSVTSAYRSYSYQEYLFDSYVQSTMSGNPGMTREDAEAKVLTYSCRAGTSEHQSGLCCDMHNQAAASSSKAHIFAETPEGKWLTENCWKFGFVLRFPEDKTEVTGITYESWHFRYVGRYHAYRMTQLGMCLEEYTAYLDAE